MTMDAPAVHRENPAYLEPLLDPDTPLKPMALLLVALGLAAREPAEHDVAVGIAKPMANANHRRIVMATANVNSRMNIVVKWFRRREGNPMMLHQEVSQT